MEDVGYALGPAFQKFIEAESLSGTRHCRSIVSLEEPPSVFAQSSYQMHPTSIDGILQACGPAFWNGNRTNMNAVIIPASIDDVVICSQPSSTTKGMAIVSASYTGIGAYNETKNYTVDANVYDIDTGLLLFQLSKLRTGILNTRAVSHADPVYCSLSWKPDVTLIAPAMLTAFLIDCSSYTDRAWAAIHDVIDLVAFKTPNLNVFEAVTIPDDPSSLWLDEISKTTGLRTTCESYELAHVETQALNSAQNRYRANKSASFSVKNVLRSSFAKESIDAFFQFAIIRMVSFTGIGLPRG